MKFEKVYSCQEKAKLYGLKDITLILDKDVNFPYYGLLIAEKITHNYDDEESYYEYISYFKEDKKKGNFENTLAFKLLMDSQVATPCVSKEEKEEDGEKIKIERYKLIYFNLESNLLKPTILYSFDPKILNQTIACEYMFVFDGQWIYTFEDLFNNGSYNETNYKHFDNILDTLKDIKELKNGENLIFFNSNTCSVTDNVIELEVFNINGEYTTLIFNKDKWGEIANALCSIRLVDMKTEKENKINRVLLY